MSDTFTKGMARNIYFGGSVFFFLVFLALTYQTEQSYPERTNQEQMNESVVRGKLVWSPDDSFDLFATLDYTRADQDCCVSTVRSILPTTRYFGATGPTRASLFTGVEVGPYSREANFDGKAFNDQSTWGASVEMNKEFEPFTLTSITAYRAFEVEDNNDADGGPLAMLNINSAHQKQNQFSQELRITSPAGQRLEYVAGLFYFDQDVSTTTEILGNFGQVLPAGQYFQNFIDRAISTRNYAVFGQATFNVTDQLRLIGGLRYTNERKRLNASFENDNNIFHPISSTLFSFASFINTRSNTTIAIDSLIFPIDCPISPIHFLKSFSVDI